MSREPSWIESDEAPTFREGRWTWQGALGEARWLMQGRGAPARSSSEACRPLPAGVPLAWLEQIHSERVLEADRAGRIGSGDALVVETTALAATVAAADCVPVLLAVDGRVAAAHAGWRGLVAGVLGATVARVPGARAWIGPAIGPCCYEVGEEVATAVVGASDASVRHPGRAGKPHLDLQWAAAVQLAAAGGGEIHVLRHCTRCREEWLESHRRDAARAGRNLASIWLPVA